MAARRASAVLAAAGLREVLMLEKASSMGFWSGEYGGRNQRAAPRPDQFADARGVMGGEVVEDDDLIATERRGEDALDVGHERGAADPALDHQGRPHAVERERGDRRGDAAELARDRRGRPPATRRPCVRRREPDVAPGLVDPDEPGRVHGPDPLAPGRPPGLVPLRVGRRLFLRVQPSAAIARPIVAALTAIPRPASHNRQCSASVASGYASNWGTSPARSAASFTEAIPGRGDGASPPVSRRRFRYRLIVATDTPNTRAAASRGIPPSTAVTTRSRKSTEYALMPTA